MKRLECLDGLRGLLAVYVMVSHMAPFAAMPGWLARALSHGGAAVDAFFILSGMVILRSLDTFAYRPGPFLATRAFRIFPVFLVVFAAAIPLQALQVDFAQAPWIGADSLAYRLWTNDWPVDWAASIAAHLGMVHGLFPDGVLPYVWLDFLGAAWSLSTEWQFYILAVLLARRHGEWRIATGFLALSACAALWQQVAPPEWLFSRAFLPNKAHLFALGIASAALLRGGGLPRFAGVLAAVLALCLIGGNVGTVAAPLIWTLCLAAELRSVGPLSPVAALLRARPVLWLGAVSYCVYLVNEPIQKLLGWGLIRVAAGDRAWFVTLWLPLAALLPLAAAWWLHTAVEQPALKWGKRFVQRQAPRNSAFNSPSPRPISPGI